MNRASNLAHRRAENPEQAPEDSPSIRHAARALVSWAGGKQHLINHIRSRFEPPKAGGKYVEPFLGAGSLFLSLGPARSLIADLNYHLIDFYTQLAINPDRVASELIALNGKPVTAARYYKVRNLYNESRPSARQAARFIFLNKTCFNGIFRVNTRGQFNVPFGRKINPALPLRKELLDAAHLLNRASLKHQSYDATLGEVGRGDSVFLDPPYPPSSKTAFFAHYTTSRFTEFDQHRLAAEIRSLDRAGVRFMMTNADCSLIRRLYGRFALEPLKVTRWISCKKKKPIASELIIHNY